MKTFNKVLALSIVSSLLLSTTGCASIFSKNSFPVNIGSATEGTHFVITNAEGVTVHAGETPSVVTLSSTRGYFKSASYVVVFSKAGFKEQSIPLTATISGWYWGNILLGGVLGMVVVDPLTGSMWKLPENVTASAAVPESQASLDGAAMPNLEIVTIDQIPAEQRVQLVRIK